MLTLQLFGQMAAEVLGVFFALLAPHFDELALAFVEFHFERVPQRRLLLLLVLFVALL